MQRAGWAVMCAILAAGLLGAFGRGVLSRVRAVSPEGGLVVEYDRFVRNNAPTAVVMTVRAAPVQGVTTVRMEARYLGCARVKRITPEPRAQRGGEGWVEFEFARGEGSLEVRMTLDAAHVGRMGTVLHAGAALVRIDQFAYP